MNYPQEGQLLVSISDMSMLKDIKKAISMVKGVKKRRSLRKTSRSVYLISDLISEYTSL